MRKIQLTKGFSLIEIMVVLVIIGLLATTVAPSVLGMLQKGFSTRVVSDFSTIKTALATYKLDNFTFPTTDQGLEALVTEPETDPRPKSWSGYLDRLPMDPWKTPYQYISPGDLHPFDVYTLGADGVRGGEDENADISIWDEVE